MRKPTSLVLCFTTKHIHCRLPMASYPDGIETIWELHTLTVINSCYHVRLVAAIACTVPFKALILSIGFSRSSSTVFFNSPD